MIERPQFKAHLHVEAVAGEGVFLLSESSQAVLRGRLFELVAPLIDGHRSGQSDDRCLRGRVGSEPAGPQCRDRGNVDDCTAVSADISPN